MCWNHQVVFSMFLGRLGRPKLATNYCTNIRQSYPLCEVVVSDVRF